MAITTTDDTRTGEAALPKPEPHVLVLFGATGDLARRKLIPGLFHLDRVGLMPEDVPHRRLVAERAGRRGFREHVRGALGEFCRMEFGDDEWEAFSERLSYVPSRADALGDGRGGGRAGDRAARRAGCTTCPCRRPPPGRSSRTLGEAGLAERARVIMEKPFGTDLESARALNDAVHEVFREDQVFRIDHFLGKEAALNMLALRFANGFLEPLWNREHIDHVQIDVPEKLSIGSRGAFYEGRARSGTWS